jgi:hypothetical protein
MRISIHQPQYLPWLGYFDKMDRSDVFVLLDDVQYKKNEWQNRNKIRNAESWQWLTVPVKYNFGQALKDVRADNARPWRSNHLKSLELNYSRAPFFGDHADFFKEAYSREWEFLADINIYLINYLKEALGIKARIVVSSELKVSSTSTRRLIDICKMLGGDTYLSGAGGSDYLEEKQFGENGIKLEFQEYKHPVYEQVHGAFEPFMSIVDLVFSKGPESLGIIRSGRVGR